MLSEKEIAEAKSLIHVMRPGTYELKVIYGQGWKRVASPTTFGKRFKATVKAGLLPGIRVDQPRTDNHNTYSITKGAK